MRRIAAVLLIASFLVACQDSEPTRPSEAGPVNFAIDDGAHGGNPEFFFFPPLVPNPKRNPDFGDNPLNTEIAPFVRICELDGAGAGPTCVAAVGSDLPMRLDLRKEQWRVHWRTRRFDLDNDKYYRIQVMLGDWVVGYRDVDPVSGDSPGACKDEGFCKFDNGSTIPINVRIEAFADCPDTRCQTKSFNLEDGTTFEVESYAGKPILLDVPPQDSQDTVTMSFGLCSADDSARVVNLIDLPTFGPCASTEILGDWDGVLDPDATATVSFCDLPDSDFGLLSQQAANLRVHAFHEDGTIESLREKDFCNGGLGSLPANPFLRFASRVRDRISSWIGVRPLMANAAVLGPGGARGGNSLGTIRTEFVIALPGKIDYVDAGDTTRTAPPGSDLSARVKVTDLGDNPIADATVRWNIVDPSFGDPDVAEVSSEGCSEGVDDDLVCTTDEFGEVEVTWTLAGEEGVNQLSAGGLGIADRREAFNGPRDVTYHPRGPFDPFTPIAHGESPTDTVVYEEDEGAETIVEDTRLLFTATGVESELLVDCDPVGGDQIFRGFYEPSYPGVNLTRVDLFFHSTVAGTHTFSLTARESSYGGPVIGTSSATVDLPGSADAVETTFLFPSPAVTPGSLVTFAIELTGSPPGNPTVFYARSVCDFDPECDPGVACTVIETNGTQPPLSTFRRNGVGVRIFAAPEPEY